MFVLIRLCLTHSRSCGILRKLTEVTFSPMRAGWFARITHLDEIYEGTIGENGRRAFL